MAVSASLLLLGVACGAGLLYLLYKLVWKPYLLHRHFRSQGVPALPFIPLLGNLLLIRKAIGLPFGVINRQTVKQYGNTFVMAFGPVVRLRTGDPELARSLLRSPSHMWHKSRLLKDGMEDLLGTGLVTSENDFHDSQRKMIAPAFWWASLQAIIPSIARISSTTISLWAQRQQQARTAGGPFEIDMHKALSDLTLRIIGQAALGFRMDDQGNEVFKALTVLVESFTADLASGRFILPKPIAACCARLAARQRQQSLDHMNSLARQAIDAKRKALAADEAGASGDLLSRLVMAVDDNNASMGYKALRDEVMTFVVAGHETTANLLCWTMYFLGKHQDWQDKARKEAQQAFGGADKQLDAATTESFSASALPIVEAVLNESLRAMPPVPAISRTAQVDTKVGPYTVPKGTNVAVSIYGIHHNADMWDDPEAFRPERFIDAATGTPISPTKAGKHPLAWMPFSLGGRGCIGKNFALLEAKIILVTILQQLKWRIAPGYRHFPVSRVTLRPKHGLPLLLTPLDG